MTPDLRGIAEVSRGTLVTSGANISRITHTLKLQSNRILVTASGKLAATAGTVRARARAAVIARPDDGVTIVTSQAPFTVMTRGVVLAAQALPCHQVTVVSMPIALAGLAGGKAPVPRQASITLLRIHPLETVALASDGIAEGVDRSLQVAVTRFASAGAEAEGARGTPVAGSSHHVRPALALASIRVTHGTQ